MRFRFAPLRWKDPRWGGWQSRAGCSSVATTWITERPSPSPVTTGNSSGREEFLVRDDRTVREVPLHVRFGEGFHGWEEPPHAVLHVGHQHAANCEGVVNVAFDDEGVVHALHWSGGGEPCNQVGVDIGHRGEHRVGDTTLDGVVAVLVTRCSHPVSKSFTENFVHHLWCDVLNVCQQGCAQGAVGFAGRW